MLKLIAALFLLSVSAHADVSVPRAKQYLFTTYDVAVNGGASVPHALGAVMPAGSIITNMWVYINTAFTDSGTGSLALQCSGTRDLMDYQDATAYAKDRVLTRALVNTLPATVAGIAQGSASYIPEGQQGVSLNSIVSVPTACEVNAVVRGDAGYVPLTTGKMTVILEYFKL